MKKAVGVVGGRGVVGKELMAILARHPDVTVAFGADERVPPEAAAKRTVDAVILSAPNGVAPSYVAALSSSVAIVDVSSDYRFDSAWVYGLVEKNRNTIRGARRISNPGCYATGAQLGIEPFLDVLDGDPQVFGISGYSGAGSTPSPKNDPVRLADNILPYALVDHAHELEISHHLGRSVGFMPHVASFFVGITLTISLPLRTALTVDDLVSRADRRFEGERLVSVVKDIPEVKDARGRHGVTLGGFAVDKAGKRAVVIVTLDNLLKGAATQAVQNMNLALGLDELAGIEVPA